MVMFVFSVTAKKLKYIGAAAAVFLLAVLGGVYLVSTTETAQVLGSTGFDLRAGTEEQRLSFFSQFGWSVDPDSKAVKEVILPEEPDDVYKSYNELQLSQGFDLMPYYGKRVKCYSYDVLNHPSKSETVRGTILVYRGKVIAGDVASAALDGFMETLGDPVNRE